MRYRKMAAASVTSAFDQSSILLSLGALSTSLASLLGDGTKDVPMKTEEEHTARTTEPRELPGTLRSALSSVPLTSSAALAKAPVDIDAIIAVAVERTTYMGKLVCLFPETLELEARFIVRVPGHSYVSTNVTQFYWSQMLAHIDRHRSNFEPGSDEWVTSQDKMFAGKIRCRQTRTPVPSASAAVASKKTAPAAYTETTEWIVKDAIVPAHDFYVHERPLSIRLALSSEKKCSPVTGVPIWMVTKKTRTVHDTSVSLIFSEVWEGKNDHELKICRPQYRVEVEARNAKLRPDAGADICSDILKRCMELQSLSTPVSIVEHLTH